MPIEMPRGLPFSVDTWTDASWRKRHHFLTHAHRDHCDGLSTRCSYPVYSSKLTKTLVLGLFRELDESFFVDIDVGHSLVIHDPDGDFSVTAFDANHCPGALMFLFEGSFGRVLHTGDSRLVPGCLQSFPLKYVRAKGKLPKCPLDYVFLDCTFGKFPRKIPDKNSAIQQVINCIWNHPDAPVVYLACGLLGQEEILKGVSEAFGSKIYVDRTIKTECVRPLALTFPEVLCDDPSSRFHLLEGFPRLHERAEAKLMEAAESGKPLIIRPSVQWYAHSEGSEIKRKQRLNEAVVDESGVWHVRYSMHSSREELEWALELLSPKWVVSTTPHCVAAELDYFKRNCSTREASRDSSLFKLLDIGSTEHVSFRESHSGMKAKTTVSLPQPGVKQSLDRGGGRTSELQCASERLSVTLFGRARLKEVALESLNHMGDCVTTQVDVEVNGIESDKQGGETVCEEVRVEEEEEEEEFSISFRRAYRSVNVAVPRPLPSLVEFMKGNKHSWKRL